MKKIFLAGMMTVVMLAGAMADGKHSIVSVERVSTMTPVGTAPRLPYQLWVKYADGKGEYRQVKWTNASEATEKAEANSKMNPVGTTYKVRGFVLGDNTTPNGYPVAAEVKVVSSSKFQVSGKKPKAETLPLSDVSIDGKNRLTWNRDLDIDQLISLPVKQQLYNYRDTYGLSTEGYLEADGWDSPTTKLKGHGSGHYMSALAMAFASCQDPKKKDLLRRNITEMVNELRQCQEQTFVWNEQLGRYWEARDFAPEEELKQMQGTWADFDRYKKDCKKYGYGYLNAIPAQHCVLIEMYRAYNNENWVWAPYYSVHKQLAGLIDIATYIDDKQTADKALLTAKDMGLWVWNRLHYRTYVKSDGRQDERRARPGNRYEMWNMYIAGEVGGMAESLARLSEMTGTAQEKARLLEAATYFDSPAFFDPLAKNVDAIRTRHANQHIPMVTGALRAFRGNDNPYYYNVAQNFWTMIQGRYRYAMGGVGNGEMFRQPYSQMTSMCTNVTHWGGHQQNEPTMNETCCAYNLAKLTKDLNCFDPDDARYMDYYERVLYNQIVGSVNPKKYQTVYQYAVGLDASKPWGNETPQSTCCGGTGVENHVKYQEAAYFVSDNTIWVALYMPTTAKWEKKGVVIKQECEWPAEKSVIKIVKGGRFAMKLRVPYWATEGFDIRLNGRSIAKTYRPSSYVEIPARQWTEKDVVEVVMPFTRHIDFGPDKQEGRWVGAFMQGPLVMAATGIKTWEEATVDVDHDLSGFIPDYDGDQHLTHYFRIKLPDAPAAAVVNGSDVDKSQLRELLLIAKSRSDEQEAWNALTVKVPEYAPWAPHGFARMEQQYEKAKTYMKTPKDRYTQEEIDDVASALNAVINNMRPGNLPELEDLSELQRLLELAKQLPNDEKVSRAINYAGMVIRYVSDGSGTTDMIERATKQLREVQKRIYIPEDLRQMDLKNDTSKWCWKRSAETRDCIFMWERGFGDDLQNPPRLEGKPMSFDLSVLMDRMQSFYTFFRDTLGWIGEGQKSKADIYKMMVMVMYSLEGTAYGGTYDNFIGGLWVAPNRIQDKTMNCMAHELGHSFQAQIMADSIGDCWGGTGFFEMTSQWMLWQVNPNWLRDENYHFEAFKKLTHKAYLDMENIYHSPYVIQWWSDLHGRKSIAELFRQGKRGEDPVITYKRMYNMTQQQFNDEMLRGYQHLVNFDFKHARQETRPYACTFSTELETLNGGWMQSKNMPEAYGFNAIPLPVSKKKVRVKLEGKDVHFGFVGVTTDDETLYGQTDVPVFNCPKDKVLKHLYLVVMGAPKDYAPQRQETYPYKFRIK